MAANKNEFTQNLFPKFFDIDAEYIAAFQAVYLLPIRQLQTKFRFWY